jgi:hypothetical protein
MNDRIVNHMNMARRALACLNKAEHAAIWAAVPPMIFSAKVTAAGALLTEAEDLAQKQTRDTTGTTEDKAREEKELEDICFTLGNALVDCCLDAGDATGAAPYDIPIYKWRILRDETLLQRADDLATAINARIAADAITASQYGLNAAAHSQLVKETNDYRAYIVAPDTAIGERATATRALRAKVKELLAAFEPIDRLIVQYKTTPAGETFVNTYFTARTIHDRGHGPGEDDPAPTPVTP